MKTPIQYFGGKERHLHNMTDILLAANRLAAQMEMAETQMMVRCKLFRLDFEKAKRKARMMAAESLYLDYLAALNEVDKEILATGKFK